VKKSLREETEKLNESIREKNMKSLEENIKKVEIKRMKKIIDEALENINVSVEEWVEDVKESRSMR
jgi:hypothetical protein